MRPRAATGPLERGRSPPSRRRASRSSTQRCASCHNLDAVNARGVTGPDLDEIGEVTEARILNAIENGGTGQKRMPAGLLEGEDAEDVARSTWPKVAGRQIAAPALCGVFRPAHALC